MKYRTQNVQKVLRDSFCNNGSHILPLNIPFLSEMNAESTAVLQVMISETKHEIHGGVVTITPLGSRCHKKLR